eukprot:SAG31_NODE_1964_length_6799_cov_2.549552_3_plen_113_part_00
MLSGSSLPRLKSGLPDPVVHFHFPGSGRPRKSSIVHSSCDPVWNEKQELSFAVAPAYVDSKLRGVLYDRNIYTDDDILGTFEIPCSEIQVSSMQNASNECFLLILETAEFGL